MNEHEKQFIDKLSKDLRPINVNWSPEKRFIVWLVFNSILTLVIMYAIGEFSVFEQLSHYRIIDFILGAIAICSVGYFGFLGIVPGAVKKKQLFFAIIPFLSMFIFFGVLTLMDIPIVGMGKKRFHCNAEILALSVIPSLQYMYFLIKDKELIQKMSLILAGISSSLFPAFIMNYICYPSHSHIIKHHLIPTALFGIVFAVVAFLIIKPKSKN